MVKWSWRNDGFEGKKRRGRPKVLNKACKIFLEKARYKMGDLTSKLSHSWQAKSTTGHEKRMFKIIRGPWDGQKTLCLVCQVTHSSSQICKEEQKPCCGRGQGWLSFLDECPKYFFFQLPKLNKYCLGVVLGPTHQLIKKLKMDHLNGYKQKGRASYWNSEYMYSTDK